EKIFDETARMKIAIKPGDNLHRFVRAVCDSIEVQVVRGNELITQEMLADMLVPRLPISPARTIDQDQRHQLDLARLHERERLVTLVHRTEAAGEQRDGVRMPDEYEFAREKVFERDQLFVFADDRVGALFPGQSDVGAETLFKSRAFVSGLHDAAAR